MSKAARVFGREMKLAAVRRMLAGENVSALAARRPAPGSLIHHSDRGVQYACNDYTALLADNDIQPSMSRIANPYDNAKAESFMKTLKQEEVDGRAYRDAQAAQTAIACFIEDVYNRQRLHSALGYRSPAEYEADHGARAGTARPPAHRSESPTGYSSAGCSPAEPASASPVTNQHSPIQPRRDPRVGQPVPDFSVSQQGCTPTNSLGTPGRVVPKFIPNEQGGQAYENDDTLAVAVLVGVALGAATMLRPGGAR